MSHTTRLDDVLIALNASSDFGREEICRLGLAASRWLGTRAPTPDLARELDIAPAKIQRARHLSRRASGVAAAEREIAARHGAHVLTLTDAAYPRPLLDLELPPPVLYCRGTIPLGAPGLAVVGPRRAGPYGRQVAKLFGYGLAQVGLTVVSGFARGVDVEAHKSALLAPNGCTVAVLGCGLGVPYPREHHGLQAEIAARGAVITEFPCGEEPRAWHFPIRNRLIAALALGTLVVQASLRSGSLITARLALDLGREVYAVPGRIFDQTARGSNALLRDGAHLVEGPEDILSSLSLAVRDSLGPIRAGSPETSPSESGLGESLLDLLRREDGRTAEQMSVALERPVDQVWSTLLELEIGGRVQRTAGARFGLTRD